MPDIEHNATVWETDWDWSHLGDEWSTWWGGTPALWYGALLPRLHAFLPAPTVLEIAPGHGRWTQYLKDLTDRLVIVDLAEKCIESCRERFADAGNIEYHVNDGRSLDMVEDGSIDFVFSFDSLVHAEDDVLRAYLAQLATKLTPDGVGFIHHSNMGTMRPLSKVARRVPERLRRPLVDRGALVDIYAWRAESVTADTVAAHCEAAGLSCIGQERISWEHGRYLMDVLTMFTRPGSRWDRPKATVATRRFRAEADRMAQLYAKTSFGNRGNAPR
jgi:SAM-dependent methyltransferase